VPDPAAQPQRQGAELLLVEVIAIQVEYLPLLLLLLLLAV
jgi:hypothetical protein